MFRPFMGADVVGGLGGVSRCALHHLQHKAAM